MTHLKQFNLAFLSAIGLSLVISTGAMAQDLSGQWQGTLVAAQFDPIDVVFNLNRADENAPHTGTLDIPSQFRSGLPIDSVSIRDQQITIRLSSIQVEYYGNLVLADNGDVIAIEGDWNQSGEYVPLRLVAGTAPRQD
jgi:hypothetical protein